MRLIHSIPVLILAIAAVCAAQPRRGPRVTQDELAVLEAQASRREFSCKLKTFNPALGFDLRYQAGWNADIKVNDLKVSDETLRIVLRVIPVDPAGEPLLLTDFVSLPELGHLAGKSLSAHGGFAVGPGRYRADWLIRDSRGRICADHWTVNVKSKDDLRLAIAPGVAENLSPGRSFRRVEPEAASANGRPYHIKILANFSNTFHGRATLNQRDTSAVAAILRTIAREPRFGKYSLAAFNMDEERVFYEATNVARIDFPALGRAIAGLKLGVIDFERLLDKTSATKFLTRVLTDHLEAAAGRPDAVLIVGPKFFLDRKVPKEAIDALAGARSPVFYLNYVGRPGMFPWRDALGDAVKKYGGEEYRITFPKDLASALSEILEQLDGARGPAGTTLEAESR